jgi:hypothetical protein
MPLVAVVLALSLSAAQARTTLHVFSPWHGSIPSHGVVIDRTLRGACGHGSGVLTRADAWHCTAGGGRVYDPCFSNDRTEAGAHVLCAVSPWSDAVAIELTRALPHARANRTSDPRHFPPWAAVTAAHQECTRVHGPAGTVGGRPVTYACAGTGFLLGRPIRGVTWRQAYANSAQAAGYHRVALREVWW